MYYVLLIIQIKKSTNEKSNGHINAHKRKNSGFNPQRTEFNENPLNWNELNQVMQVHHHNPILEIGSFRSIALCISIYINSADSVKPGFALNWDWNICWPWHVRVISLYCPGQSVALNVIHLQWKQRHTTYLTFRQICKFPKTKSMNASDIAEHCCRRMSRSVKEVERGTEMGLWHRGRSLA